MNEVEQLKMVFLTTTKLQLERTLGAGKTRGIMNAMESFLNDAWNHPKNRRFVLHGKDRRHAINAFMAIALYRALEFKKMDEDTFYIIFKDVLKAISKPWMNAIVKQVGSSSAPFKIWTELMRRNAIHDTEHFGKELEVQHPGFLEIRLHRCFYHEIFCNNGVDHLTPVFCEHEMTLPHLVVDWIKASLDTTIAQGNPSCTFKYSQQRKKGESA